MQTLIAIAVPMIVAMLLVLPGYCSEWWPVWLQAASLVVGVAGVGTGAALIGGKTGD